MVSLKEIIENALNAAAKCSSGSCEALEYPDTANIDLQGRPVCLLGGGAVAAADMIDYLVQHYDVRAVIDNPRAGLPSPGGVYKTDDFFLGLAVREPRLLAIMCCGADQGVAHFDRLARMAEIPVLTIDQVRRRIGHQAGPDIGLLGRILETDGWYADALSRRTLYAILHYRLTLSYRSLDPIRQPTGMMYFSPEVWAPGAFETVIDGGAYTGDTFADFCSRTGGQFTAYHAFEPNYEVFSALENAIGGAENVTIHRHGLWDRKESARFVPSGLSAHLDDNGGVEIPLVALDEVGIVAPSFVKLDIEGAEANALKGGQQTISDSRPVLAVCAYHRPDDLLVLPEVIQSVRAGSNLKLRHHSPIIYDTVLYAVD